MAIMLENTGEEYALHELHDTEHSGPRVKYKGKGVSAEFLPDFKAQFLTGAGPGLALNNLKFRIRMRNCSIYY